MRLAATNEWVDPQREAEASTVPGELAPTIDNIGQAGMVNSREPNYTRIYEPLNGDELIEAIVGHARKMLVNSGKFQEYLIYERAVWKFNFVIQWDAFTGGESVQSGVGEVKGDSEKIEETKVASDSGEIKLEGKQLNKDMAPDEIREKTGQDIPVIARNVGSNSLGASGVIKKVSPSLLKRR